MKKLYTASFGLSLLLMYSLPAGANKIVGQVADKVTGSAIAGAKVQLLKNRRVTDYRTATDYEGRFSIVNIPPGVYEVSLFHPSYIKKLIQDVKVDVHYGTALTRAELRMEPVPPLIVNEKTSKPANEISRTPLKRPTPAYPTQKTKIPPGPYSRWKGVETTSVNLKSTQQEGYQYNSRMTGRVLDKKTNEPMTGGRVRLLYKDGTSAKLDALIDNKGDFIILNVPPSVYHVEISFGHTYVKQLVKDVKIEPRHAVNIGTIFLHEIAAEGDTIIIYERDCP